MDAAILRALEYIRCPFLDVFFSIFTALGEELIIAAIVAVVYICFSKRAGEQALLTVLTASCITAGVKGAVRRARPYAAGVVDRVDIDNPFVSTVDLDADMSFPSGHATCTSGFFATVAISTGSDVKSVSSILGHSNAAMTLNVYASADAEAKRHAMERTARAFSAGTRSKDARVA